jgi:hypothetical protein
MGKEAENTHLDAVKMLNKLAKAELLHLLETIVDDPIKRFKRNLEYQIKDEASTCWECRSIARKLNLIK